MRVILRHFLVCEAERLRQTHDARHVGRAAAHGALLVPARDDFTHAHARTDVQHAHPFRAVELMPRKGEHIHGGLLYVQFQRARRLHRVGKKGDAALAGEGGNFRDRLNSADLVVCRHHADKRRIGADGIFQLLQIDPAELVHRGEGDLETLLLQFPGGGNHGGVLDGADDEVLAPFGIRVRRTAQSPVVRFGAARSEIDLVRLCADEGSDGIARLVYGGGGAAAAGVLGIGVAEIFRKIRQHFL